MSEARAREPEAENERLRGLVIGASDTAHPQYERGYYLAQARFMDRALDAVAERDELRAALDDHEGTMWECSACPYQTTIESLVHRQSGPVTRARPYKHYRADGWPYCPQCDEDELWSAATYATVETIVGCYSCGWKPSGAPTDEDKL
jgi:hypothetical protein